MAIDGRKYNSYRRSPSKFRKIRKIVTNNATGDVYGVTIPRHIANEFMNCNLMLTISGTSITMTSGCLATQQEISKQKAEQIMMGGLHYGN